MDELAKARTLLKKYKEGTCTRAERVWIEQWFFDLNQRPVDLSEADLEADLEQLHARLTRIPKRQAYPWAFKIAAAIVVCMTLGLGIYWMSHTRPVGHDQPSTPSLADVAPGHNQATLTLADGTTVDLSADQKGVIVTGTNMVYQDGSAVPRTPGETSDNALQTLSVPLGGQYQITLADGTKVWLNAASSLRYPAEFSGASRQVELTGEAYFEVAKNAKQPFKVQSGEQQITVLGTQFNVQAYEDMSEMKTTLVEGSVAITAHGAQLRLRPGEQALVSNQAVSKKRVDVEAAIAWKDGYFKLDGDLKSIMAQIGRWYNVEVVFAENVDTDMQLMGRISRDKKLNEILLMLQDVDERLRFKLDGRRLSVMQ